MDSKVLTFPRLIIKPDPVLTPEEEMRKIASKKVDFLIESMGPTAGVLDAQNRQLTGKPLRETMMEREIQNLIDKANERAARQKFSEDARVMQETRAVADIIEGWNDHYSMVFNGKRIKSLKKLDFKCPFCGEPHTRPRGALIELWQWRNNHIGRADDPAPVKSESIRCAKCGEAYGFQATTNALI